MKKSTKKAQKKYEQTEKGKERQARYSKTQKGKKSQQRADAKRNSTEVRRAQDRERRRRARQAARDVSYEELQSRLWILRKHGHTSIRLNGSWDKLRTEVSRLEQEWEELVGDAGKYFSPLRSQERSD